MKIVIKTTDAKALKAKIMKEAKDGTLNTWIYKKGKDDEFITHSPEQWFDKVILEFIPSKNNDELEVKPGYWTGKDKPTNADYGTILGRFAERLWIQYRDDITSFNSLV